MSPIRIVALATVALAVAPGAVQAQTPAVGYRVVKTIPVGGDAGWDYLAVQPEAHRLFVSHGTHVVVIDLARDTVIGDIANTPGVHGIAFAPELGRGFTSNGRDSSVTVFDLNTLAEIGRVAVPARNPDAIFYDPGSKRVFTFNGGSASVTAIDAATGQVVGSAPLGGKPESATTDGSGRIFVNIEDKGEVVAFDPRTLAILSRWSIAPCEEPTGIAIDVAHHRLFSGCGGNAMMTVLDTQTGRMVATIPAGQGIDAAAFEPATGLAFVSSGDGLLTVIHEDSPDTFTVVDRATTQRSGRTMALDPATHRVYVSVAKFGETPPATAGRRRPRPPMLPGSFAVLELAPE